MTISLFPVCLIKLTSSIEKTTYLQFNKRMVYFEDDTCHFLDVSDITSDHLNNEVSEKLGEQNLADCVTETFPKNGLAYETAAGNYHIVTGLSCKFHGVTKKVIFLVVTGSCSTYLSRETLKAFFESDTLKHQTIVIPELIPVELQGIPTNIRLSSGNFKDINVLGLNFLHQNKISRFFGYDVCRLERMAVQTNVIEHAQPTMPIRGPVDQTTSNDTKPKNM